MAAERKRRLMGVGPKRRERPENLSSLRAHGKQTIRKLSSKHLSQRCSSHPPFPEIAWKALTLKSKFLPKAPMTLLFKKELEARGTWPVYPAADLALAALGSAKGPVREGAGRPTTSTLQSPPPEGRQASFLTGFRLLPSSRWVLWGRFG